MRLGTLKFSILKDFLGDRFILVRGFFAFLGDLKMLVFSAPVWRYVPARLSFQWSPKRHCPACMAAISRIAPGLYYHYGKEVLL